MNWSARSPKPHHITTFAEVPFTSEQAECNVLQDPNGNQAIDIGYLAGWIRAWCCRYRQGSIWSPGPRYRARRIG